MKCRLCEEDKLVGAGTRVCDSCWELEQRVISQPELAMKVARAEYRARADMAMLRCAGKYLELPPEMHDKHVPELVPYEREVTRWLDLGHDAWYEAPWMHDPKVILFWNAGDALRPKLIAKVDTITNQVIRE